MKKYSNQFERRRLRNRNKLKKVAYGKPRLTVYRSSQHIYAQIIDDLKGVTLASASTVSKDFTCNSSPCSVEAAYAVGKKLAESAKSLKISDCVFDRGAYLFHGRVKALATGARESGLKF